jgi:hypothetical protein
MSTEFSEWWKNLGTAKQVLMISCIAIVLIAIVCMIITLVMMNKKNKTNDQNKTNDETQNNQDNNGQPDEEENINNLNTNNLNQNTNNISNVNENQNNNILNTNNIIPESFSQNNNNLESNNLQNNQSNGILTPSDLKTDGYKKGTILFFNGDKMIVNGEFKNGKVFNGSLKIYSPDGRVARMLATDGRVSEVAFDSEGNLQFEGVTANGKTMGRVYSKSGKIIEQGLYNSMTYSLINGEKQVDVNDPKIEDGEKVFVGTIKNAKPYDGHWLEKNNNAFYKVGMIKEGEEKIGIAMTAAPDDFINKRIQENLVNNNISTNVNLNLNNSNINNIEL